MSTAHFDNVKPCDLCMVPVYGTFKTTDFVNIRLFLQDLEIGMTVKPLS